VANGAAAAVKGWLGSAGAKDAVKGAVKEVVNGAVTGASV